MHFLTCAVSGLALVLPVLSQGFPSQYQNPLTPQRSSLAIPLLGYGTWNLDKSNISEVVSIALETGYRHLDCAAAYRNEKEVGKGIARGLAKAGIIRDDIWVTSKLWNDHHRPDLVQKGLDQTLSDLGVGYLDLYLMHWPVSSSPSTQTTQIDYIDTWHAMEKLLKSDKVRHIGVANFSPEQMVRLISSSTVKPAAHQMELHPYLQQTAWVQWHESHGIHVTAYSPFANANPIYGAPSDGNEAPLLLENEVMKEIAKKRSCTPATVALQWGMGRGTSVIPKSSHSGRIEENFKATECDLMYEDLKAIEKLGEKYLTRFNDPSKSWGVNLYHGLDDA